MNRFKKMQGAVDGRRGDGATAAVWKKHAAKETTRSHSEVAADFCMAFAPNALPDRAADAPGGIRVQTLDGRTPGIWRSHARNAVVARESGGRSVSRIESSARIYDNARNVPGFQASSAAGRRRVEGSKSCFIMKMKSITVDPGTPTERSMVFCRIEYVGENLESIRRDETIPSIFKLKGNFYEVLVDSRALPTLKKHFKVDDSYDPLQPAQGLVNVQGILCARKMVLRDFKKRATLCEPFAEAIYEAYLEGFGPDV